MQAVASARNGFRRITRPAARQVSLIVPELPKGTGIIVQSAGFGTSVTVCTRRKNVIGMPEGMNIMAESRFQTKVASYLRKKGCYVMVIQPQAGIPDGCPDIIALCDGGGWLALELKASFPYTKKLPIRAKKGAFQPLQLATVARLDAMFYSRVVWPENWDAIKSEIDRII